MVLDRKLEICYCRNYLMQEKTMSLLKKIWQWLVAKTSTSPKLVEVISEEVTEECEVAEIFLNILREAGISKHVKKVGGLELFEEWYSGPCNEEAIRASIAGFKLAHPAIAAKMAGRL